jgi:Spy/CpxP family protein refolding chaperone
MEPVSKARVSSAVAGVLIFVCGMVAGGALVRARQQRWVREHLASDPSSVRTELFLRGLDERVSLTRAQRTQARALLVAQAPEYRAAVALSRPRLEALRRQFARDFAPALTPEQRAELDQTLTELEARR